MPPRVVAALGKRKTEHGLSGGRAGRGDGPGTRRNTKAPRTHASHVLQGLDDDTNALLMVVGTCLWAGWVHWHSPMLGGDTRNHRELSASSPREREEMIVSWALREKHLLKKKRSTRRWLWAYTRDERESMTCVCDGCVVLCVVRRGSKAREAERKPE